MVCDINRKQRLSNKQTQISANYRELYTKSMQKGIAIVIIITILTDESPDMKLYEITIINQRKMDKKGGEEECDNNTTSNGPAHNTG